MASRTEPTLVSVPDGRAGRSGAPNVPPVSRELLADLETPISAYLRLRDLPSSFLLESVEGPERSRATRSSAPSGGWSVAATGSRCGSNGTGPDRARAVPRDRRAGISAATARADPELPPFAGGASATSPTTRCARSSACRTVRPTSSSLPVFRLPLMDTVVAFDHRRHTCARLQRPPRRGRGRRAADARPRTGSTALERLAGAPARRDAGGSDRPAPGRTSRRRHTRGRRARAGAHPRRRHLPGRALPAVRARRSPGRPVRRLPRAPRRESVALHVLPRRSARRHAGRRLARDAGARRGRPGRDPPDRRARGRAARTREEDDAPAERAARRSEGARRARHARRPRRATTSGRVAALGSVAGDASSWRSSATPTSCTSSPTSRARSRRAAPRSTSLRACFPAGTVSGAPKVRAMEIIDELEPDAPRAYAGAVGYFGFDGIARLGHHDPHACSSEAASPTSRPAPASSPTRCRSASSEESVNKARALLAGDRARQDAPAGGPDAARDRQLRLVHLQPRPVPRRAGRASCDVVRNDEITVERDRAARAGRHRHLAGAVHAERGRHVDVA